MKLYLMRHGIADEAAASMHDFDRALTAKGRTRSRDVAKLLLEQKEVPEWVISSPLVRALQTAEIAAAVLDPAQPVAVRQELAPDGDAMALVHELVRGGAHSALLVGHEPWLSGLLTELVGHKNWIKSFLKSMVVGLWVESDKSVLRFVLDPKSLEMRSDL